MAEEKIIKKFSMELPIDFHSDFKSACAQSKKSMGKVMHSLMEMWMNGEIEIGD